MPGGTARLRVSGAMTRRFGSVIGPSLKGSNSLVWLMSGCSGSMMIGNSWALRPFAQWRKPYGARRRAAHAFLSRPWRGVPVPMWDDLFGNRQWRSMSRLWRDGPAAGDFRRQAGGGAADRSVGGRGAITLQRARFF